jgi:O-antigen/teichoic acid export membrane protein
MNLAVKKHDLLNNVLVIGVGSIASKLLIFLLLPLVTRYLSKADFGFYELIITSVQIFIPLITLQMNDCLFRFLLDTKDDSERSRIISNAFTIVGIWLSVCLILYLFYWIINQVYLQYQINNNLFWLILIYAFGQTVFALWQQVARGNSNIRLFALSGVISGVLIIGLTSLATCFFQNHRLMVVVLAAVCAFLITIIFLELRLKVLKSIKFKAINFNLQRELIRFSLPLLPNSLSWWILHMANRYIILYFSGIEAVATFSVASKFAGWMTIINSIFITAWQESAIKESQSDERGLFYSKTFAAYTKILFSAVMLFLPLVQLGYGLLVGSGYDNARGYIPMLFLSSVFISFTSFFGVHYLSTKKTMGALTTTVIGAIVNVVVLLLCYSKLGLSAVAIAQLISGVVMSSLRYLDLRQTVPMQIDFKQLLGLLAGAIITILIYLSGNQALIAGSLLITLVLTLKLNQPIIVSTWNLFKPYLQKKAVEG